MNSEQFLIFNTLKIPVLSLFILIPLAGAALTYLIPKSGKHHGSWVKLWAVVVMSANLMIAIPLYKAFDTTTASFQFVEYYTWIPSVRLNYIIGVDGISATLILLVLLISPVCVLCSWVSISNRIREFVIIVLIIEASLIGVLVSMNLVLLLLFWEAVLLPLYLLIDLWGEKKRHDASVKMFMYSHVGSVFFYCISCISLS